MIRGRIFRDSRLASPIALAALTGTAILSFAAIGNAGPRHERPDFPLSVVEARDKAEARFQQLDADRSGEVSLAEFRERPRIAGPRHHRRSHHAGAHRHGERDRNAADADLFEGLDADGDGVLSAGEFDTSRMRELRREAVQARIFEALDEDGSGGLSREELPDPSRRLAAMDGDGDGTVTRQEAREHHRERRRDHRPGDAPES